MTRQFLRGLALEENKQSIRLWRWSESGSDLVFVFVLHTCTPYFPTDNIRAMIIWRIRWKIIRTVLCCIVHRNCTQLYAHSYEQFLQAAELGHVGLCIVSFCVFFVFFNYGHIVCLRVSYFMLLCIIWLFFGYQYQRNRLPGKTRPRNDLLCVDWDVKLSSPVSTIPELTSGNCAPINTARVDG